MQARAPLGAQTGGQARGPCRGLCFLRSPRSRGRAWRRVRVGAGGCGRLALGGCFAVPALRCASQAQARPLERKIQLTAALVRLLSCPTGAGPHKMQNGKPCCPVTF